MNRLYIEKLVVSGGGHRTTVINFKPGLNFILGPSNTGKSLVMDCLDYMFGFSPKKNIRLQKHINYWTDWHIANRRPLAVKQLTG